MHKSVHETVLGMPGQGGAVRSVGSMLDRLTLLPLPTLQGERVVLREAADAIPGRGGARNAIQRPRPAEAMQSHLQGHRSCLSPEDAISMPARPGRSCLSAPLPNRHRPVCLCGADF